jgi:hypothetical protein
MNTLIPVVYVGPKDTKTDNVANSGTVWRGAGDVQHVTPAVWGQLSAHPEVWRHAEDPMAQAPVPRGAVVVASYDTPVDFGEITAVVDAAGNVMPLSGLTPEQAMALAIKISPMLPDEFIGADDHEEQPAAPATHSIKFDFPEADKASVSQQAVERTRPGPKKGSQAATASKTEGQA